jgi:hypothetical protein
MLTKPNPAGLHLVARVCKAREKPARKTGKRNYRRQLARRPHTAREIHTCDCCPRPIYPGDVYDAFVWTQGNRLGTVKCHQYPPCDYAPPEDFEEEYSYEEEHSSSSFLFPKEKAREILGTRKTIVTLTYRRCLDR